MKQNNCTYEAWEKEQYEAMEKEAYEEALREAKLQEFLKELNDETYHQ